MTKYGSGLLMMLVFAAGPVWAEPGDPVPAPATPEVRTPPPAAVEAPKLVAKPDKPKPVVEPAKPAPAATGHAETIPPVVAAPGTPASPEATSCVSFSCWLISFAMLIIGFAAGFVARHIVSRRKLGGMSVRIGTWRGIP